MTRHFLLQSFNASAVAALLIDAARCWRDARDNALSPQPCLFRALDAHGGTMLTPALDSLCLFFENALGRSFAVGDALTLSDDELLLIGLVEGSMQSRSLHLHRRAAEALDVALLSTQVLLKDAFALPAARMPA